MGANDGILKLSSYTPADSNASADESADKSVRGFAGASGKPDSSVLIATPDFELLVMLRSGNQAAGNELVSRYCPMLIKYLERLTGNSLLAEELHQQTWLSAIEYADRFKVRLAGEETVSSFKAWLFRIATNKVNDHWRSGGRDRKAKLQLSLVTKIEHPAADQRMEASEQESKLQAAIAQLPENQREVIVLRYYSNLKFAEIAQVVGCPLNTALGRMHKAMLKLKELMEA